MWPLLLCLLSPAQADDRVFLGGIGVNVAYAPFEGVNEYVAAGAAHYTFADQTYEDFQGLGGLSLGGGGAGRWTWADMTLLRRRTAAQQRTWTDPGTDRRHEKSRQIRANTLSTAVGFGRALPTPYLGLGVGLHMTKFRLQGRSYDSYNDEPDEANFRFGHSEWVFQGSLEGRIAVDADGVLVTLAPYLAFPGLVMSGSLNEVYAYDLGAPSGAGVSPDLDARTRVFGLTLALVPDM